jgi:dipeptidyl aminopeptidase/acylaminoacyl peptidase
MTDERLLRSLGAAFDDLAAARTPDYLEAAIERASSRPQRPAWTFPGRWLPMADITRTRAFAPRLPWRTIAVALLAMALIVGAALAFVGAQRRLPAPFGPAENGLLAYAADGDIHMVDPATGVITTVVAGADQDFDPIVSPDGSKLAFRRTNTSVGPAHAIIVADVDGSNTRVINSELPRGTERLEWSPDSRSLLVLGPDRSVVWLISATEVAAPRVVAKDVDVFHRPFQPPDGSAILIGRPSSSGLSLVRLDLETLDETVLARSPAGADLGGARWSPDGSQVVYNATPADDPDSQRLFIVNADGSGTRQVTSAPGVWFDIDASWSPDGSRIAFIRYERVGETWDVRPIGIYSVADGSVTEVGPLPRDARAQAPSTGDLTASPGEGFQLEWSPDGESLVALPSEGAGHPVIVDASSGTWQVLDVVALPAPQTQAWQRVAP